MHVRRGAALTVAAATTAVALLSGCSSSDDWSRPHDEPTTVGALSAGYVPTPTPSPEATITPRPGSWDDVHPAKGYRVVLLTAGTDRPTRTVVNAIRSWADDEDVSLKTVTASRPSQYLSRIDEAIALKPDVVIAAGNALVDPLTAVTASHLSQNFLVVGAELAEPTHNVTAADWDGATFRGEGLNASSTYDASSFTPDRAGRALRAGVAAVLNGLTGIVVWVD